VVAALVSPVFGRPVCVVALLGFARCVFLSLEFCVRLTVAVGSFNHCV
jgi:hypothetical protein